MSKKIIGLLVASIVVVPGALVAMRLSTSHQTTPSSQIQASSANKSTVQIQDYMFSPATITVKVGTTVTWINNDVVHHSITSDSRSENAPDSPLLGKGEAYKFTFTKTGAYHYHCMPHASMHGTIVVTN